MRDAREPGPAPAPRHVLGDWGTSRLRLALSQEGRLVQRVEGPGIGDLRDGATRTLEECLEPWRQQGRLEGVWLCGMAGSRHGLAEVPYLPLPLTAAHWAQHARCVQLQDLRVTIAAGVAGRNALHAPDVMRGEETQAFGALSLSPALAQERHCLLLPGTHSKWAVLEEGALQGFTTFMSGELFALLRERSTLLRAAAGGAATDGPVAPAATDGFRVGLACGRTGGDALGAVLFQARAAQLTEARSARWAEEYLSGALLGAEVNAVLQRMPELRRLHVIGEPRLTARYRVALEHHGVEVIELDGERCALAGLARLAGLSIEGA